MNGASEFIRTFAAILFLAAFFAILAVCAVDSQERIRGAGIMKDEETGCEYLITFAPWRSGITPRLDSNGRPICKAPAKVLD